MPPPPTFDVRLARARMLAPNVRELGFERASGAEPFTFAAGQWVSLVLPLAEGEARRAYSIASPPDGSPTFEVAVTKVEGGPGSTYLHELPVGSVVRVIGPQGFFTRPPLANHPSLFVGTGTGFTPLRSMIKAALAAGETTPMTLLFGVRHEADRLYREELEALTAQHPNLRAHYTISQPGEDWAGLRGYVQTHVEAAWRELEKSGAPHVYICGLERMVGAVRDLLRKQMGVERKQVHSERYD
ncbi:MAG TPA: FAD-dependent oxidoreductase [Labilithrix sp.]|nr:FAD-dependent oxidoreductase [Labilithrix sp.]